MTVEERRRLFGLIFQAMWPSENGSDVLNLRPREAWQEFVERAVETLAVRDEPERKTGVKHAEVVTTPLVQDERGWLRLAS